MAVYSSPSSGDEPTSRRIRPVRRDLEFTKSDHCDDGPFFWKGVVWTPERPTDDDGLPMFHSSEEVPEGVTPSEVELVAPWVRKYWFSEIRSSYLSTVRYYNGWIPWYGTRPNPMWYRAHSLGAFADVLAVYDDTPEAEGTRVYVDFPSHRTKNLNPGGRYRWDLRSAIVAATDEDDEPTRFTMIRTHVAGRATVRAEWSMQIPIGEL